MTIIRVWTYSIAMALFLISLTFLGFFFSDPLHSGVTGLALVQFIAQFAWVLLVVGPAVLISLPVWNKAVSIGFLVVTFLWTAILIIIRLLLLIQTGDPYLGYLFTYPVFIFTDILAPLTLLFIWFTRNRLATAPEASSRERSRARLVEAVNSGKEDALLRDPVA